MRKRIDGEEVSRTSYSCRFFFLFAFMARGKQEKERKRAKKNHLQMLKRKMATHDVIWDLSSDVFLSILKFLEMDNATFLLYCRICRNWKTFVVDRFNLFTFTVNFNDLESVKNRPFHSLRLTGLKENNASFDIIRAISTLRTLVLQTVCVLKTFEVLLPQITRLVLKSECACYTYSCPNLITLQICDSLCMPVSNVPLLENLDISTCYSIGPLPKFLLSSPLQNLSLHNCSILQSINETFLHLVTLNLYRWNNENELKSSQFPNLQNLTIDISECMDLSRFDIPKLKQLNIKQCNVLSLLGILSMPLLEILHVKSDAIFCVPFLQYKGQKLTNCKIETKDGPMFTMENNKVIVNDIQWNRSVSVAAVFQ